MNIRFNDTPGRCSRCGGPSQGNTVQVDGVTLPGTFCSDCIGRGLSAMSEAARFLGDLTRGMELSINETTGEVEMRPCCLPDESAETWRDRDPLL